MNPNNCEGCTHRQNRRPEDGHCYMFKDEPDEVCMQRSVRAMDLIGRGLTQPVLFVLHDELVSEGQRIEESPHDSKATIGGCGNCDHCQCSRPTSGEG